MISGATEGDQYTLLWSFFGDIRGYRGRSIHLLRNFFGDIRGYRGILIFLSSLCYQGLQKEINTPFNVARCVIRDYRRRLIQLSTCYQGVRKEFNTPFFGLIWWYPVLIHFRFLILSVNVFHVYMLCKDG